MRPKRGAPGPCDLSERQVEALTVAMIVAPGVYARNRLFDLLSGPGGKRARMRAATVRGLVVQLARASALTLTTESRGGEPVHVLRYQIVAMGLTRVVDLTSGELAALRLVAERANVRALPSSLADKELVMRTLARLLESGLPGPAADLVREATVLE